MIGGAVDELLVLGADAPVLARLLAAREGRQQVGPAVDQARIAYRRSASSWSAALSRAATRRQHFPT